MRQKIIITLTPGRLSQSGNRLTAWQISTPEGVTLSASKRAIDLPADRPYFDQADVDDILRRAGLPGWKHVRAANVTPVVRRERPAHSRKARTVSAGWYAAGWYADAEWLPGSRHGGTYGGTRADAVRALLQAFGYTAGQLDFAFKAGQGYRLDSIERQTRPEGAPVYVLTCVLDDHRGDLDGRYRIAAAPVPGGIGWRVMFCGDRVGGPAGTMTEALALMDQHRGERQTARAGGAV